MITRWLVALTVAMTSGCLSGPSDSSQVEVLYQREGGFAGVSERLEVHGDGRTTLSFGSSAPVSAELSADRLAALRAIVHTPEFRALQRSYVPEQTCCDRRLHTFVVRQLQGEQTVATLDGVQQPEILSRALVEVDRVRAALLER